MEKSFRREALDLEAFAAQAVLRQDDRGDPIASSDESPRKDTGEVTPDGHLTEFGQKLLRVMPSLRIMALRVVRGMPSRVAAVLTTPLLSFKTWIMCSRSTSSSVPLPK